MVRKNEKKIFSSQENNIKKSNEFSMAKLNHGLSLKQMQLLAYTIYATQKDGSTKFTKAEFEKKFSLDEFRTQHAKRDTQKLLNLSFSVEDLENDFFEYSNVFQKITYDKGTFSFKWTDDMIPHILDLKERGSYLTNDFPILENFKSGFTWLLYDYLKGNYGNWYKELSKDAVMRLFNVENVKSYLVNTGLLKSKVIDIAIKEINDYTELEVWYTEKKVGNKITGFILHWSTGKTPAGATENQLTLLREIHNEIEKNMFDYLSLNDVNDLDQARRYIIAIKDMKDNINKGLSVKKASEYIQESKESYKQLETLLENEGNQRDTSIYYNWLEEEWIEGDQ